MLTLGEGGAKYLRYNNLLISSNNNWEKKWRELHGHHHPTHPPGRLKKCLILVEILDVLEKRPVRMERHETTVLRQQQQQIIKNLGTTSANRDKGCNKLWNLQKLHFFLIIKKMAEVLFFVQFFVQICV